MYWEASAIILRKIRMIVNTGLLAPMPDVGLKHTLNTYDPGRWAHNPSHLTYDCGQWHTRLWNADRADRLRLGALGVYFMYRHGRWIMTSNASGAFLGFMIYSQARSIVTLGAVQACLGFVLYQQSQLIVTFQARNRLRC